MKLNYLFLLFIGLNVYGQWQQDLYRKIKKNSPPVWMIEQVQKDLSFFNHGITEFMLNPETKDDLAEIIIKQGRVHIKPLNFTNNWEYQTVEIIKKALEDLCSITQVPNVKFLISMHDGFISQSSLPSSPIFAFSKDINVNSSVILIPDYYIISKEREGMHNEILQFNNQCPWHKKIQKAFWRGSSTGIYQPTLEETFNFACTLEMLKATPRFKLVELSKKNPEQLDARFTRVNFACSHNQNVKEYVEANFFSPVVSIRNHIDYKYQILIDGNTSAWERAFWQLWSNSVILKQESNNVQWFYGPLKPYIHYIPFSQDCSNLLDIIKWANAHDDEAKEIAVNATEFAKKNLTYSSILYYFYYLLSEYAKLQLFVPDFD